MIVSACRRLHCLSAYQKYTSFLQFFLRFYILKNPAIWLADTILAHNSRTRIFPDIVLVTILVFILDYFQEKLMTKIFRKSKTLFWGHFGSFMPKFGQNEFSCKNGLSVLKCSNYLPLYQQSQNSMSHSWEKCQANGWTNRWTNRQTDRQTDRIYRTLRNIKIWKERTHKNTTKQT